MSRESVLRDLNELYDQSANRIILNPEIAPSYMHNIIRAFGVSEIVISGVHGMHEFPASTFYYNETECYFYGGIELKESLFSIRLGINFSSYKISCKLIMIYICQIKNIWDIGPTPKEIDNIYVRDDEPELAELVFTNLTIEYKTEWGPYGGFFVEGVCSFEKCTAPKLPPGIIRIDGVGHNILNHTSVCLRMMTAELSYSKAVRFVSNGISFDATVCTIMIELGDIDELNAYNYTLEEGEEPIRLSNIYLAFVIEMDVEYYVYRQLFYEDSPVHRFYSNVKPLRNWICGPSYDTFLSVFLNRSPGWFAQYILEYMESEDLDYNGAPDTTIEIEMLFLRNETDTKITYNIIDLNFILEIYNAVTVSGNIDGVLEIHSNMHNEFVYGDEDSQFYCWHTIRERNGDVFTPGESMEQLHDVSTYIEYDTKSGEEEFEAGISYDICDSYAGLDLWADDFNPGFIEVYGVAAAKANDGLDKLKISELYARGSRKLKTLYVSLTVDTSKVLTFQIGNFGVTVKWLSAYLNYTPHNTGIGVSGTLELGFSTKFELFLAASYDNKVWQFEASLGRGGLPLSEIIENVLGWHLGDLELKISRLYILFRSDGTYMLAAGISTKFKVLDDKMEISVEGEIKKLAPSQSASVMLKGKIELQSFVFIAQIDLLSDGSKVLSMLLKFDKAELKAKYETDIVTVEINNLSIGILLKLLFKVWRPNVKFYLSKPWDILERIGFSKVLIQFNTVTKDVSVFIALNINLLAIEITGVRFSYQRASSHDDPKFMVDIEHRWLISAIGSNGEELAADAFDDPIKPWDALNENSPAPLDDVSQKFFKLSYFGIGRHIDLHVEDMPDGALGKILDKCRENVQPSDELPSSIFNEKYGWFIGAKFTLLESFEVALLFYDPVIYGLQVKVTQNTPLPLKGLDLTIYYRKVTEKIGVFYINVALPSFIKHMEFGLLSITLPNIELWIYTNGNFKINFGFPYNNDFSQSFSLSYGIFAGRGGFYFGYLNGDTSQSVPKTTRGYFDPVIELGIGFTAGIGKSFNTGILQLKAMLEMTAIFTGVFAKFHYYSAAGSEETCMYYKCTGLVMIAGEISGEVNFFIIKASFRIYARASVFLALEDGEESLAIFEASFGVSASIKILFIKISFSFSFTYKASFILGNREPRPWRENYVENNRTIAIKNEGYYASDTITKISAVLTPYFSADNINISWNGEITDTRAESKLKTAFFVLCNKAAFGQFYALLAERSFGFIERENYNEIFLDELKRLLDALNGQELDFAFQTESLNKFFNKYLSLNINVHTEIDSANEIDAVPMPLPPVFNISWFTLEKSDEFVQGGESERFFNDYVKLVSKLCVEKAVSYLENLSVEYAEVSHIINYLMADANTEISSMISRVMFSGARKDGLAVYEYAKQQFNSVAPAQREPLEVVHRLILRKTKDVLWVADAVVEAPIMERDLDYPTEPVNIKFISEPKAVDFYSLLNNSIAASDEQAVYEQDTEAFYLWKPTANISHLHSLEIEAWEKEQLAHNSLKNSVVNCETAALIEVRIKKIDQDSNTYSFMSAPAETRSILDNLAKEDIKEVTALFSKSLKTSSENKPKGAYFYLDDMNENVFLVRRNLSEITTSPVYDDDKDRNADNTFCAQLSEDNFVFLNLLNTMLKIGGEGHYVVIDSKIDDLVFDNEGEITLFLLIMLSTPQYATHLRINEKFPDGTIPVIVNKELGVRAFQTALPGFAGFEFEIEGNKEYTDPFHLLYYVLFGNTMGPLSMQERDSNVSEWLYYSGAAKIPPVSVESESPYGRIVPSNYEKGKIYEPAILDLEFYFADIAGNVSAAENHFKPRPIPIKYYDNLYSVSDIPISTVNYGLKYRDNDTFWFNINISAMNKELFTSDDLTPILNMRYQLETADSEIAVNFKIGNYSANSVLTLNQKEEIICYLKEMYCYLLPNSAAEKPENIALSVLYSNPLPRDFEITEVLEVSAIIITTRDEQFVDKSSKLKNIGEVSSIILPDDNIAEFCAEFEKIFVNAKLLNGAGLFAAVFPPKVLSINPTKKTDMFLAIKPLCKLLRDKTGVTVIDLEGVITQTDFFDIDMEIWADSFLSFYERILEPFSLNKLISGEDSKKAAQYINRLLEIKVDLAEKITINTEGLFNPGLFDESAINALKDLIRKDLSLGYRASTAIVYDSSVNKLGNYSLDGDLKGVKGILGAKATNAKKTVFIAAPENVGANAEISMKDAVYTFTHIEDNSSGKWYSFINPFQQFDGYININLTKYESDEGVKVPIPHRKYPEMPIPTEQKAVDRTKDISDLQWAYEFKIKAALNAQDKLYVTLHTENANPAQKDNRGDLFDALAQFIYNYENYEEGLFGSKISLAALEHFIDTAQSIQELWINSSDKELSANEFIMQAGFNENMHLCNLDISRTGFLSQLQQPVIHIQDKNGHSVEAMLSADKTYYTVSDDTVMIKPGEYAEYSFSFNLKLSEFTCLRMDVYFKKNYQLLEMETNPSFVYETEKVGFSSAVYPHISLKYEKISKWEKPAAYNILEYLITNTNTNIHTELTAYIGQSLRFESIIAYRPAIKRIRYKMNSERLKEFLDDVDSFIQDKGLKQINEQNFYVKLEAKQFAVIEGIVLSHLKELLFEVD